VRIGWQWIAVAAGLVLSAYFVSRWTLGDVHGVSGDLLAQEVLDSHLRSLMPGHLTDVSSPDQHAVKAWFGGKLDYSPPVAGFAEQGFPLAGGRLDSLNGRTIAALIYQRNQHVINLYVFPAAGLSDTRISRTARQGYNILQWSRGGMDWWISSDLNASELESFANLVRGGPASVPAAQ
jgi:anti-sigma factor RsiW